MSWLRSSDVTRSFVGPVLAFVACGLMLTMWWHSVSSITSSKQQTSLFLKTQVIDAGRHRPGDRVDVTFAIQNASDRQAKIVPRTACDCVSTSGDSMDVQPGTVHDASFRWTIGTPMLGDYGVRPMSQTIDSGNQRPKLQWIEAEPHFSMLTDDEYPSTIDVQMVSGHSKGTFPVRFSLLILS
ncbi:hypothetical protein [Crateriforma conspicua]|uniref:hypothetical protein n=1 Tax=Crateriforma conspicua TaxID=2527996 RepID=UPI0011B5B061|nr:hypothetical protein [Crateriforma conspicua]